MYNHSICSASFRLRNHNNVALNGATNPTSLNHVDLVDKSLQSGLFSFL
jgi:hypothetical protein